MSQTVADYVLGRLRDSGVHRIFGYPGDGINAFLGAFDRAEGDPEFIQVRHEEMAAFMAVGHAKFAEELGVCIATSGPGAIHLLNGLYDAKLDHQPVLAIVGQQKSFSLGASYQQEVDLQTLFKDVSVFVNTCIHPAQARHLIDRGVRTALAERGVATIIIPSDVQELDAEPSPPREHGAVYSSIGKPESRLVPSEEQLDRAAEVLNAGERVAMLIGQGAAHAEGEVVEAAEVLGAGVAKALLGRAVLSDDLPFVTGPIGLLGSSASYEMIEGCDTLLMVGTSFPYAEWLPAEGQAQAVEIDIDPKMIGIRYPLDAHLVGDATHTLRALLPRLRRKDDRTWREKIEADVATWWEIVEAWAMQDGDPMNPQRVMWELSRRLPDNVILTADSGSSTNWWARTLRLRRGMKASLSGTLATMGPATPYAIAAKLAYPERPVVGVLGDGAFQMNGMNELITAKRYQHRWSNPTLVFCVFNNEDLNQVTWEQRAFTGDPKFEGSQSIPDVSAAKFAELLGFEGIYCDDPERMGDAWDAALRADRPCVLEVKVDAEIPPIPPHLKAEFLTSTAKAMLGDEERFGVMAKGIKGVFRGVRESLTR